ncbi:MAG: PilZ domain-containing protein [Candidatus Omnitrophica bacterium]|nr:PilZ domain-containing protein [Candidatus Omnitrophota bacterium]MCM8790278.1 PilZ domain-containing protein [Candidatus Omnitrophota bacterium]
MTERRKFLRFEAAFSAICDILSDKSRASSKVKNISKEGALIILDRKLDQGTELNLSMEVPGDNVPVFAACEVAWQRRPATGTAFETGVRFTKINGADKGRLLEYIYLQWLRFLDKK